MDIPIRAVPKLSAACHCLSALMVLLAVVNWLLTYQKILWILTERICGFH
jgi:hypothetical protein